MAATEPDVYLTGSLARLLLELGSEADPEKTTVPLLTSDAGKIDTDQELADDTPVFTDFYPPNIHAPLKHVFGVNLGIPHGETSGRFISHPEGDRDVRLTDNLHQIIFVGVPPWEGVDELTAYTRTGQKLDVVLVDAELDHRPLPADLQPEVDG